MEKVNKILIQFHTKISTYRKLKFSSDSIPFKNKGHKFLTKNIY